MSGLAEVASPASQMATAMKDAVKPGVEEAAPVHRIRITLSSRNVKNLEKGALTRRPFPLPSASPRHLQASVLTAPFTHAGTPS